MKVSIIIPVYNSEKTLKRCIESLINQTIKSVEFIFVNDGSTDNSKSIIEGYKDIDERIKIINKNNEGVSSARNDALSICKGEFIGFVDSDDYVEQNMFELLYNKAKKEESQLAICGYIKYFSNEYGEINEERFNYINRNDTEIDVTKYTLDYFCKKHDEGYLCNKIFKRSVIEKNNIRLNPKLTMCEDLVFNLEFLNFTNKISNVQECLYHYVINYNSATYKLHRYGFEARKLAYEKTKIISEKLNKSILGLSDNYSKYPYLYSKEQLLFKRDRLINKYKKIIEICEDDLTKDIASLIRKKEIDVNKSKLIFYKLAENRLYKCLYIYLYLMNAMTKIKNSNKNIRI